MPEGLLAPRLYRAAFAPALLALIVLAFSLQDPGRSVAPELTPPGFSAARAQVFASQAISNYGARESGSVDDARLAALVEARLEGVGFRVIKESFRATTLHGRRTLTNVVGIRSGPSDRRLLVIASRDGSSGELERSGALETGILLELARVLEGRAFDHTIVLASVSGGVDGGLGAKQLLGELRGPFDAVIALRNVGAAQDGASVVIAGDSRMLPDERFSRTVRRITALELRRVDSDPRSSVAGQVVRMGFPLALGEQATMASAGISGVSVSPGGEPLEPPQVDVRGQVRGVGLAALRVMTTMDRSFEPEPPSVAPLKVGGKLIPQWALILLIATLFFPLIVASIDAWARARRWRQPAQRGVLAPALAAGWLLVLGLLLRGVALSGVIDAPPLAPDPLAISGVGATLVGVAALLLAVLGVLVAAASARQATQKGGEAAFALWVVFTGLAVFAINPVTAGFLMLAMHLVILMLLTSAAPRRRQVAALALVGALPIALSVAYYAAVFELGLGELLRYAVLLEAGGFVSLSALAAGCLVTAAIGTSLIHLWWSAPRAVAERSTRPSPQRF